MRIWILAGLLCFIVSGPVLADGFAYGLPPDGAWVKYKITVSKYDEWNLHLDRKIGWVLEKGNSPTPADLAQPSYFLVRFVGRQAVKGKPCRWVELVDNPGEEGKAKPMYRVIILKLLIPEAAFAPGADPFDNVQKMYIDSRRDNGEHYLHEVIDKDREKYELERFRAYFPVPPKGTARKRGVERKTILGLSQCEELEFDYGFEGKLSAGKLGFNCRKAQYKVLVSETIPLGTVAVRAQDELALEEYGDGGGARLRQTWLMEVAEIGHGAKSGLPDKK